MVLLGADWTSELLALNRRDGRMFWLTRVPNWIHNDTVVASGVVIVGFGNNERGAILEQHGSDPSGVAAFDLDSGVRRWIRYEHASVMTSPVIFRDIVVRDVGSTGGRRRPAHGKGLVPHRRFVIRWRGHAAPSVAGSVVIMTAIEDSTLEDLVLDGHLKQAAVDLFNVLRQRRPAHFGQQWAVGLSVDDGRPRWKLPLGRGFTMLGHTAGMSAAVDSTAYVVSPIGRTVTALSTSGHRIWQRAGTGPLRGPPTVWEDQLITIHQNDLLTVRSRADGSVTCTAKTAIAPDRAGFTVGGKTAYITGRRRQVVAVPMTRLSQCAAPLP